MPTARLEAEARDAYEKAQRDITNGERSSVKALSQGYYLGLRKAMELLAPQPQVNGPLAERLRELAALADDATAGTEDETWMPLRASEAKAIVETGIALIRTNT